MNPEVLSRLIEEARSMIKDGAAIQDLSQARDSFPEAERRGLAGALGTKYRSWFAKAIETVPAQEQAAFRNHYEGSFFGAAIKKFLDGPLELNPFWVPEKPNPLLGGPWLHPFEAQFAAPLQEQIVILERLLHRRPALLRTGDRDHVLPRSLVGHAPALQDFLAKHPYENNVFLMMRYRDHNEHVASILKTAVEAAGKHPVVASDFSIADELGPNVMGCLLCCRYGIALFDEPEPGEAINPNVSYELGIMHYLDRDCLLLKSKTLPSLQSDILAKLYVPYDPAKPGELIGKVREWLAGR